MTHTKGKWEVDIRTGCFAIYTGEHINCLAGVKESAIVYQNGRGKLSRKYDGYKLLTKEQIANAHRIVHCVNVHDALIRCKDALQDIIEIGKRDTTNPKYDGYYEEAKQIIKQEGL